MFMEEIQKCKEDINAYLDIHADPLDLKSDTFIMPVMTLTAIMTNLDDLLNRYLLKENESTFANVTYLLALTNELAKLITKTEKICLALARDLEHMTALSNDRRQKLKTILVSTENCLNRIFTLIHMDETRVEFTASSIRSHANDQLAQYVPTEQRAFTKLFRPASESMSHVHADAAQPAQQCKKGCF